VDIGALKMLVLELLEPDCYKTVDYLVEELRVEYPRELRKVMSDFQKEYDLSGCGAEMSPITAINAALISLWEEGKVEKKREDGVSMWCLMRTSAQ